MTLQEFKNMEKSFPSHRRVIKHSLYRSVEMGKDSRQRPAYQHQWTTSYKSTLCREIEGELYPAKVIMALLRDWPTYTLIFITDGGLRVVHNKGLHFFKAAQLED